MGRQVIGADGIRVRESGQWARVKLRFLELYLPYALAATKRKNHRVYVDLFAGPGVNFDGHSEFDSGALIALRARAPGDGASFTDVILVNIGLRDHQALERRIDRLCARGECNTPRDRIVLVHADANEAVRDIVIRFDKWAYLLAFADPESPSQLPFSTIQALKEHGHRSVDLYSLFPLDMAIKRLLSYSEQRRAQWAHVLDSFFGTDQWRTIATRARANPDRRDQLARDITDLYLRQLKVLWAEAGTVVDVRQANNRRLYRMLFAASHEVALRIERHIKRLLQQAAERGQADLFA
jgi:three-Cys-motif partner protein